MGPDTIAKKALIWLGRRTKRVAQHIAGHNSTREALAKTRPWILRKAAHSVTIGGDRVTKKICERTLKTFDHYTAQRHGRHAFTKLFGRQIGRSADQTAFRLIVDESGRIITGFAITAAQAAASTIAVVGLEQILVETIEGLNRVASEYAAAHPPREEGWVEKVADFFMSDLGNEPAGANEGQFMAESRYQLMMQSKYISSVQESQKRTLSGDDLNKLKGQFNDGIAGAIAPYVDDEG